MTDNRRVEINHMSSTTFPPFFVNEERTFGPVAFAPQDNAHNPSQAPDDGTALAMSGGGGHFQITALPDGRSWTMDHQGALGGRRAADRRRDGDPVPHAVQSAHDQRLVHRADRQPSRRSAGVS